MSSYGSWSVKGIDDRARAVAKEKARLKGVTLGDYINNLLLDGHSEAGPRDVDPFQHRPHVETAIERPAPSYAPAAAPESPRYKEAKPDGALDSLARRIEAAEARSTLAITGIDQSVLGLLARLENTEQTSTAIAADVERMIDELRETQEALQAKVRHIEADDNAHQSLEAMKALELALGKLATHVYEENSLVQDETNAIKGRMEVGFDDLNERVEGMEFKVESTLANAAKRVEKAVEQSELRAEGTSRHLSERFSAIESGVATKLAKVDEMDHRMATVEGDVSGALTSMEGTVARIQDRLNRAENTTDAALKALEQTFASLDDRIETVAKHVNPEHAEAMRQQLEQRFDNLAADLRASVDESRAQLASEIEQAAAGENPQLVGRLGQTIDALKERLASGEEQLERIATGLDTRMQTLETHSDGAAIEKISQQVDSLADHLDERVSESEQRSAAAIEQVGEQVASAITRVQARQDAAAGEFESSLAAANERQDARLSRALANISERLADMQSQTVSVMSPVQKAMASLAQRLEAVEDFNTPPHVELTPEPVAAAPEPYEVEAVPIETDMETIESLEADIKQGSQLGDADGDGFIAGLPEFDAEPFETEPEAETVVGDEHVGDFDPGFESWDGADDDYTTQRETADPTWDDGQDEARDSDIFADGFSDFQDGLTEPAEAAENDNTSEFSDLPEMQDEAVSDTSDADNYDLEGDDQATPADYLARARRAAISAAVAPDPKDKSGRRAAPLASKQTAPQKSRSKAPAIAAVTALALATAGASGFVMLRGKQDKPAQPVSIANLSPEITSAPTVTAAPSLEGVNYDETSDAATLDSELFEEEGSAAPNSAETVRETPVSPLSSAPVEMPAPLPTIAKGLSLEEASADGDPVAEYLWGQTRLEANDFAEGPEFIRRAAQQGVPAAQYRLAKLHEKGLGVPRDLTAARTWTERAARGGNVKAMHDLAVFFADGEGGPQSYAGAAEWFRQAADYGLVDSQYNLAVLYENGLGISPSKVEALYWYEIAARNGDASAPGNVTELRNALDLSEAQSAQRRAATWTPSAIPAAANGEFGVQNWQNGSREQVASIQQVLNGLGYHAGTPDGLAGTGTRNAIRAFQTSAGLTPDGQISNGLVEALNEQAQSAA